MELGVILGAFYRLRRGKVVGLKWEAIDFEANTITIEHTVTMATIDGKSCWPYGRNNNIIRSSAENLTTKSRVLTSM